MKEKVRDGFRLTRLNTGCVPGYSVAYGRLRPDLEGLQMAALGPKGLSVNVWRCDTGELLFSHPLVNRDRWSLLPVLMDDVDGDGENEVVVPERSDVGNRLAWFDGTGKLKRHVWVPHGTPEPGSHVEIDSMVMADTAGDGVRTLHVWINGYGIVQIDHDGRIIKDYVGYQSFCDHFLFAGDIDNDGRDELLFSASPKLSNSTSGDTFYAIGVSDPVFARNVREIGEDQHVDDLIVDDFDGRGRNTIFSATGGAMLDGAGTILWDSHECVQHGQWCSAKAVRPDLGGKQILLGELWGRRHDATLLHHDGTVLWHYDGFPKETLVYRPCFWRAGSQDLIAVIQGPGSKTGIPKIDAPETMAPAEYDIDLLSVSGERVAQIPYGDYRVGDWHYNCENTVFSADVDGDGQDELVVHTASTDFLIIGRD